MNGYLMAHATVLLVEDEALLREGIQEVLEMSGYRVIGAGDGIEALEWLAQVPVSLVITDLLMPKMNGVEFIERVRDQYPELPIIVASGSTGPTIQRLGLESIQVPGTMASIRKPFKGAEMVALVQQVLAMPTV